MPPAPTWLLLACAACASVEPAPPRPTAIAAARLDSWVDSSAAGPGDGSRSRPFRSLDAALAAAATRPTTVHLATGLYPGPFELPAGVKLVGAAAVVLHAEGPAVLHAAGGAALEGLMVQGAAIGLVSGGEVELRAVKFSGQSDTAVRVESGTLAAIGCELAATIPNTRGLAVGDGAEATVTGCSFLGPFRRAIEATSARVRVDGGRFEGPLTGVHQVGGTVTVRASAFSGGRGPALFAAGGTLTLRQVSVLGHEYGLQTGPGTQVDVSDFTSVRADRAAIALVQSTGRLEDVVAIESGSFGALQLLGSDLRLERLRIHSALSSGLFVRLGRVTVEDAVITGVRAERDVRGGQSGGDAVVVRGAEAHLTGLTVAHAEGAGVVATAEAHVLLTSATLDGCAWGGVVADRASRLDAVSLLVRGSKGAALTALDRASVRVDLLRSEQVEGGAVSADCAGGARVGLARERTELPVVAAPCVGRWTR